MAAFAYLGNHEAVTLYGVTFPQGEPVEVDHPVLLRKLAHNNHFKLVAEEEVIEIPPVADETEEPDYKAKLLEEAAKRGIEVKPRWGIARIQQALGEQDQE